MIEILQRQNQVLAKGLNLVQVQARRSTFIMTELMLLLEKKGIINDNEARTVIQRAEKKLGESLEKPEEGQKGSPASEQPES